LRYAARLAARRFLISAPARSGEYAADRRRLVAQQLMRGTWRLPQCTPQNRFGLLAIDDCS
jgi:hypothetical protein